MTDNTNDSNNTDGTNGAENTNLPQSNDTAAVTPTPDTSPAVTGTNSAEHADTALTPIEPSTLAPESADTAPAASSEPIAAADAVAPVASQDNSAPAADAPAPATIETTTTAAATPKLHPISITGSLGGKGQVAEGTTVKDALKSIGLDVTGNTIRDSAGKEVTQTAKVTGPLSLTAAPRARGG